MKHLLTLLLLALASAMHAQGNGNPILPGYFADPTIKKFGDTYYIYATTDGSGAGFGPAQCWQSKDMVNWTIMPMNWPDSHWIWAPDVMKHTDGKYYYLYCQPCKLHLGVGDTPRGPWKNVLGESEAVLVEDRFVKNAITLDGQTFVDDDGEVYMYWGTWGIYKDFGCGTGRLNKDLKSFAETRLIVNTEATDFFEAPFVIKKDGVYYLTYSSGSCHDHTYRVQYATSKKPMGPYKYGGCILETNEDGTVHGPGHHSILKEGNEYYIVYHRHDNPHSNRGFHRQICIDKLEFGPKHTIRKVTPTHKGLGYFARPTVELPDLAYKKAVKASSFYDDNFKPENATDDDNGTLWRPRTTGQEWIEIDLGESKQIKTIWTQFEYGTQFYQYTIETSADGKKWTVFADKSKNRLAGSPMVDFGNVNARYVRLNYLGGQKKGFGGALWNIKVFGSEETSAPQQWIGASPADWNGISLENNEGQLAGEFNLTRGHARIATVGGRQALELSGNAELLYNNIPAAKEYTATMSVYENGKWQQRDLQPANGKLSITANETAYITNIRLYNWKQEQVEKDFDAASDIVRLPVCDDYTHGTIIDICADDYQTGDTVGYIRNKGIDGWFEAQKAPAIIEAIDGKKAFRFDGKQVFRSSFAMPAALRDNTPYSLEAWIYNPEMELNECVADFTTTHDELEKIMLVNGTEPRCGLMNHYGWYEDAGSKEAKQFEKKWQHVRVEFDGRMEKVFINDTLISEKDIQLLIKPSQYATIGLNNENEWPFTGYIHSIKLKL
ncbi:MAG: family 43 glycosylhydrolase [Bacteroidaceae bacterium]|nr:family 43 glycosylhydrolase [Bacteroidaceae bacterium]